MILPLFRCTEFVQNSNKLESYISDAEWEIIEPLLSPAEHIGRPREVDLREIVNAIFYVLHEGCTWRGVADLFASASPIEESKQESPKLYFGECQQQLLTSNLPYYFHPCLDYTGSKSNPSSVGSNSSLTLPIFL